MNQAQHIYLRALSRAFQHSDWSAEDLVRMAKRATGSRAKWVKQLADEVASEFAECPTEELLVRFLTVSKLFLAVWDSHSRRGKPFECRKNFPPILRMWPPSLPLIQAVPQLEQVVQLAVLLKLKSKHLDWYADLCGLNSLSVLQRFRHYRYEWIAKSGRGPVKRYRLLESPSSGLKRVQRIILRNILNAIPVHRAAHGFTKNRSTCTHASIHSGQAVVLRFDLADFFTTVSHLRVQAIFRAVGYSNDIARVLTGLCTTRLPTDVWEQRPARESNDDHREFFFRRRHLAQGAPTSPALANLSACRLDVRLSALAITFDATYTRYADDLTFSGDTQLYRRRNSLTQAVARIVADEGFQLNPRKNRVMTQGHRQKVTGLVVNVKPNIQRADYDRLKAILTNCIRHGATAQNRENRNEFRSYLRGRVAFVAYVHPARGAKLLALYERIQWPPTTTSST